jgi:hypothetical protein
MVGEGRIQMLNPAEDHSVTVSKAALKTSRNSTARAVELCALVTMAFFLRANDATAATISAASCSNASVQAAVDAAATGDTVLIPAGTCTWTAQVTLPASKAITLQGAGIDATTIVDGVSTEIVLALQAAAGAFQRVTALTMDARLTEKSGSGPQIYVSGSGLDAFRIDHIRISNLKQRGILVNAGGGELSGLIDHNVFECPGDFSCKGLSLSGAGAEDSRAFSRPIALGTNKSIFVEDNVFNYAFPNDGALDAYAGARYVFRFNTVNGTNIEHHGADSGGFRGVHSFEIYGNNFTIARDWRMFYFRSGTGVLFDSTWAGPFGDAEFNVYRARPENFPPWGQCDGSSAWDGNRGSGSNRGWPCLDQTGYVFTQNPNGSHISVPMYLWNNLKNGTPMPDPQAGEAATAPYLVLNRDFYNEVSPFTGASGVGRGPIASRPSTCTPGVAYWATDEGEWNSEHLGPEGRLYKCAATNVWTPYYMPYIYPHPLVAGRPAPPTPQSPRKIR